MIPDRSRALNNQELGLLLVEFDLHHTPGLVTIHNTLGLQVPEENLPRLGRDGGVALLVDDGLGHDGAHLVLTNERRVFRVFTNESRVFGVLTYEKRVFRVLTNGKRVLRVFTNEMRVKYLEY